ncbi:MAG: metal ABC transporter permease [Fimbriimonadaceae bacterium]
MIEILSAKFFQQGLLAGLLASVAAGLLGPLVLANRMVFLAGGIAHAAFGGVGLGYYFRFDPTLGALGFSGLAATAMAWVEQAARERVETLVGALWAVGMALGVVLLDATPGYKSEAFGYLFGSIVFVTRADLLWLAAFDVVLLAAVALSYRQLLAASFDPVFARTRNVATGLIRWMLVAAVAVAAILTMRVVGLILVLALLTLPPAIAGLFCRDMRWQMFFAFLVAAVAVFVGMLLGWRFDQTSGASIVLVLALAYPVAYLLKRLLPRRRPAPA